MQVSNLSRAMPGGVRSWPTGPCLSTCSPVPRLRIVKGGGNSGTLCCSMAGNSEHVQGNRSEIGVVKCPAPFSGSLKSVVAEGAGLSLGEAVQLIELGAVYFQRLDGSREKSAWKRAEKLGPAAATLEIERGQWLRIHCNPRRYAAAWTTDWQSTVLHRDAHFVIVNKPAGIPVQSHDSNSHEFVPRCVERALNLPRLHLLHRLDQCTTGVVAFALTKPAAVAFMAGIEHGEVEKAYKVLTDKPLAHPRELRHHMYPGPFGSSIDLVGGTGLRASGPRLLCSDAREGWQTCTLEVQHCQELDAGNEALQRWLCRAHDDVCGPPPSDAGPQDKGRTAQQPLYEAHVKLGTGRTHQIRAQLSACGVPVLFDTMYGPLSGQCVRQDEQAHASLLAKIAECKPVRHAIGLHAYSIAWKSLTMSVPPPWA